MPHMFDVEDERDFMQGLNALRVSMIRNVKAMDKADEAEAKADAKAIADARTTTAKSHAV